MQDNAWKLARRVGIGGSDAAAILGLSPWKSPMDVWLDKMGLADEVPEDRNRQFLLELGTQLEPVIARLYERETGKNLQQPVPGLMRHPVLPMIIGSPDRLVKGEQRGVELKTENQFMDEFGEPGTDQVPYHYLVQCAHYMAVTGMPVWDLALLHGGAAFSIYTIERDLELEHSMLAQLMDWWDRHIVAKTPPDVDGSDAWRVYLRTKFPRNLLPLKDVERNGEVLEDVKQLARIRDFVDQIEQTENTLETRIKLAIGEHDGLFGEFGKITWKRSKDGEKVDWEEVYKRLAVRHVLDKQFTQNAVHIINECTTPRPGSRRFLFQPKKEWIENGKFRESPAVSKIGTTEPAALPAGDREHRAGGASEGAD